MRILPIALVDPTATTGELVERAHRSSRITHGAPACVVACALYVLVARELLAVHADRASALDAALELLRAEYRSIGEASLIEALDGLLAWPGREGHRRRLPATVVRAVQYGDDTDTTAAIAGGLAGLHFGADSIPADWLSGLRGRAVVDPLLDRLLRRLDASREPSLPAMDPDFTFSMSDLDRIYDRQEWVRIHRS
jgi:ADP-ribosylglycohydrolase